MLGFAYLQFKKRHLVRAVVERDACCGYEVCSVCEEGKNESQVLSDSHHSESHFTIQDQQVVSFFVLCHFELCASKSVLYMPYTDCKVAIFFLAFLETAVLKSLVGAGEGSCHLNGT